MKELLYNKVTGFPASIFPKIQFIHRTIQTFCLLCRNTYFKEDIPMAASAILFYKLYSFLVHWIVFYVTDFIETEFLRFKVLF